MKVTFLYPSYESLGIEYCSAVLRQRGHETSLVVDPRLFRDTFLEIGWLARFFDEADEVARAVARESPGLVAIGAVTDTYRWAVDLASRIKRLVEVPVVLGGIHATSVGAIVLEEPVFDFVIRGEGEDALADLVDSLEKGRAEPALANLAYRDAAGRPVLNPMRPPVADLDSLPFPDKSLYDGTPLGAHDVYTIVASRGCRYACSYCNNSMARRLYEGQGPWLRRRTPANVVAELVGARARYGFGAVNFYDELFTDDPVWLEELTTRYASEVALPYLCCVHPLHAGQQVARLLASSGCVKVDLGVQTTDPDLRHRVVHRPETTEQVGAAIDLLRDHGLSVHAENIFGFPGQTEAQLVEAARFYNDHRPSVLKVYWLAYYPGTDIIGVGAEAGELKAGDVAAIERGCGSQSFATGGTFARPEFQRLFALFALLLLLPRRLVRWLLGRGVYHWLPVSGIARFSTIVMRLLNTDGRHREIMLARYRAQYRHYLAAWFRRRGRIDGHARR